MWTYSKDGKYTVKTVYMIGKGKNLDEFHATWVNLWKMEISPKARHFMWRVCTKTLLVCVLLKRRHVVEDASCPWYLGTEETIQHALFTCSRIQ